MELHLNTYGSYIRKKDGLFEVSVENKKVKISPEKISSIIISNAVSITSDVIHLAMNYNIDIVFLDDFGDPYGRVWYPKLGSTTLIRRKQLEMIETYVGLKFIKNYLLIKNMNQYRFLKQLISKREGLIGEFDNNLSQMKKHSLSIYNSEGTINSISGSLMGWEGAVSKNYFNTLSKLLPSKHRFHGRSSRPAKDPFNAFLNYGYGLLYSRVEKALIIAGLDPYLGLLHTDNYNKKSFVFDFIEPYRIFVEEPTIYVFSRSKFKAEYVEEVHQGVTLSENGKKFFVPLLLEHFDVKIRYQNKNRKRIDQIQIDAHSFANFLINKKANYLEATVERKLKYFLMTEENESVE